MIQAIIICVLWGGAILGALTALVGILSMTLAVIFVVIRKMVEGVHYLVRRTAL